MSQCSISWHSYKKDICDGLTHLQQEQEFVDMTLAAEGHLVKVHKNLMALSSPYLKEMLHSAPCQHPVIFLNNISHDILGFLLEYIYTGEVNVPVEKVNLLINAAKALHIKGLQEVLASSIQVFKNKEPPLCQNEKMSTKVSKKKHSMVKKVKENENLAKTKVEQSENHTGKKNNKYVTSDLNLTNENFDDLIKYRNNANQNLTTCNFGDKGSYLDVTTENTSNNVINLVSSQENTLQTTCDNINLRTTQKRNDQTSNKINLANTQANSVQKTYDNVNFRTTQEINDTQANIVQVTYDNVNFRTTQEINEQMTCGNINLVNTEANTIQVTYNGINLLNTQKSNEQTVCNTVNLVNIPERNDQVNFDTQQNFVSLPQQSVVSGNKNKLSFPIIDIQVDVNQMNYTTENTNTNSNINYVNNENMEIEYEYPDALEIYDAADNYDASLNENYDAPSTENNNATTKNYGAPLAENYDEPSAETFNAQTTENYGAPYAENYNATQTENYDAPFAESYNATSTENYAANYDTNFSNDNTSKESAVTTKPTFQINSTDPKVLVTENTQKGTTSSISIEGIRLDIEQSASIENNVTDLNANSPLFALSTRGCLQMILNRFMYYCHYDAYGGMKRRWRCLDYRRLKCKAFIDTEGDVITCRKFVHNHPHHDKKIFRKGQISLVFTSMSELLRSVEKSKTGVN